MGRTAFLDLRAKELSLSVFDSRGAANVRDILSLPVGEGLSFSIRDLPADISESCVNLPVDMLNFRIISLPFSDMNKIRDVIPFEMDSLILGGSGTAVFDACVIGQDNGKTRVLVAYVAKDLIRTLLQHCRNAGLDPRTVTCLALDEILSGNRASITPELLLAPPAISDSRRTDLIARALKEPTINFRRGEFAYTADKEKTARSLRTTVVLAVLLLVLFLSYTSLKAFFLNQENRQVRDEIRKIYVSLFPEEKKIVNELLQLKSHMKELQEKERAFVGLSPLGTLLDLSKIQRPGASFSEITIERDLAVFRGECATLSDVQGIKQDIEGFFSDVTISDTKPSAQGRTAFTITAKGKRAA